MKNYKQLAVIYLKFDKKRSLVTVTGVTLCVMVLFTILNLGVSYAITARENMYYAQEQERDVIFTFTLTVLLVAYIFSILSVGIVRNSIQLICLEQIRDYGILRCIGASKKQLKSFIYSMGLVLELTGIAAGVVLSIPFCLLLEKNLNLRLGIHIIGLPLILFVFLGDLYFVMRENCRFVNELSPVAAVRGEFKVKKERIKARKSGLIGKILGVEGDYAFKSLLRNPARFWKTTGSIGFGIGMAILAFATEQCIEGVFTEAADHYGKYQIYGYYDGSLVIDAALAPETDAFSKLDRNVFSELEKSACITAEKPLYQATMYPAVLTEVIGHYTQEYATDCDIGRRIYTWAQKYEEEGEEEKREDVISILNGSISVYGYDAEDYQNLKKKLVSGTLELSEQGILLANHSYNASVGMDVSGTIMEDYTVTDYQVGDRITLVDLKELRTLVAKRLETEDIYSEKEDAYTGKVVKTVNLKRKLQILNECHQELVERGAVKTYIIEGILAQDTNRSSVYGSVHLVLPLERYFEVTETTEEMSVGKMYHMKGKKTDSYILGRSWEEADERVYADMEYVELMDGLKKSENVIYGVVFFALFVAVLSIMNILNTLSSNLHLRRKEFAQLRVLGMSKKHLIRTVMLEGVITAFFSSVMGIALGAGITRLGVWMANLLYHVNYRFPWGACGIMVLGSFCLFCGSIYGNLRGLKMEMAEELTANGE